MQAQDTGDEGSALFPPPKLDYAQVCILDPENDPAPGKADAALSPKEKLHRARLLMRGSASVIPDAERAAGLMKAVMISGSGGQKAAAKFFLAKLLKVGRGVTRDEVLAEKLWEEAATVDPYNSPMELALLAEKRGDIESAAEYYRKAAAAGNPRAYLVLSTYYRDNLVEPPSANAAAEMITLAQNFMLQALSAGRCGALRDMAIVLFSNKYRLRNDALAMQWFAAGAEGGDVYSMMMMADGYASGYRLEHNPEKAQALWLRAAERGNSKAMLHLGQELLLSQQNEAEAIPLISDAARRGQKGAVSLLIKYYRGDYGQAPQKPELVEWLQYSVNRGNAPAEHLRMLADALSLGDGIAQDTAEAIRLYERAAEQNDFHSLVRLGDAYKYGRGVAMDAAKSYRFYRLAAAEGNVEAMTALIENYRCGVGKPANPIKTEQWRRRAMYENSRQVLKEETTSLLLGGDKPSQYRAVILLSRWIKKEVAYRRSLSVHKIDRTPMVLMALAFRHGFGVKEDNAVAEKWLALAAAKGNGQASGYTALAEAMLDERKLANNPRMAEQYLQKAEDLGSDQGAYLLGKLYEMGATGFEISPELAKQHYLVAANQNHPTAQRRLGALLLRKGDEAAEGRMWLQRASFNDQIGAMFLLADDAEGRGDNAAATKWLDMAENHHPCTPETRARLSTLRERIKGVQSEAELLAAVQKGSPNAVRKLAIFYLYQGNSEEAVKWYEQAAASGDATAMLELGNAYYTGAGVEASRANAQKWWEAASKAGSVEAKTLLDSFNALDSTALPAQP